MADAAKPGKADPEPKAAKKGAPTSKDPPPPAVPVAAEAAPATSNNPAPPPGGIKKMFTDFGQGTKNFMRFVFVDQREERRKELVESLRFYVTYK